MPPTVARPAKSRFAWQRSIRRKGRPTGAAGAYGGYVIQLAKAEGLTVLADASEKDERLVERRYCRSKRR